MSTISKTFRLQQETVASLQELVEAGMAPNPTRLIEELVRREKVRLAKRQREDALTREWAEAMRDPQFVADQNDVEAAFREADEESAGLIT